MFDENWPSLYWLSHSQLFIAMMSAVIRLINYSHSVTRKNNYFSFYAESVIQIPVQTCFVNIWKKNMWTLFVKPNVELDVYATYNLTPTTTSIVLIWARLGTSDNVLSIKHKCFFFIKKISRRAASLKWVIVN